MVFRAMSADQFSPTLVVICGLPGAGKTTHARRLEQEMPALRFCPDEWMQALGIDLYDEDRRDRPVRGGTWDHSG
jgi:predicted kinase